MIKNLDGDQPNKNNFLQKRAGRALGSKNPNAGRNPTGKRLKLNDRFLLRFVTSEGRGLVEIWKVKSVQKDSLILAKDDKEQAGETIEITFLPIK